MSAPRTTRPTFLPLGPVHSDSFPKAAQSPKATTPTTESSGREAQSKSRSSSLGSNPGLPRVLKLGPVYYGEHAGDHQSDWHDVAVE